MDLPTTWADSPTYNLENFAPADPGGQNCVAEQATATASISSHQPIEEEMQKRTTGDSNPPIPASV